MSSVQHPGVFIKDEVLAPRGLTVSSAAKVLAVGRPAFSAVLNGRASVSAAMAKRLEVAFGVSAQKLLELQSEFDAANETATQTAATAKRWVVPLQQHTASEIERWASRNLKARSRFPVLLRTLVNSTCAVNRVDFPGNDDAERAGWDGWTESATPTPWIPSGKAGWELGTTEKVRQKADQDYDKSVKAHTPSELADITFIFVTPRHWPGKLEWVRERKAERKWRDVRAYDSSDLEQWVEQSVPAQVWLASELNKAADGAMSLDDAWREWADVTAPPMPASLFDSALGKAQADMVAWLKASPDKPYILASDSTEEAMAFLATVFQGPQEELAAARGRAVVFKQPGVFPRLGESLKGAVVVAATREVERELAPFIRTLHAIVIQPRNATNATAKVTLEPLAGEAFRKAFEGSELGADQVQRLARESGRSLTVLRRRLADSPAIRTPRWADEQQRMTALAPLVLAGTWNSNNKADTAQLCELAGEADYELLERRVSEAASLQDPPFWMVSTYRGVTSKIDFLFAAPGAFTRQLLTRFLQTAKKVLSEDDPRLDLPDDERWAAAIHNKARAYSHALRDSIAETLVLLALHGEHLFHAATGFDGKAEADQLVRELLTPLTPRRLEANARDLMAYAEAAPDVFLSVLEKDVKQAQPASFALLRPAGTMFGGCPRSELLWALEGLAWSESTLHRSALILAKLATVEIKDNWSNKPIATLTSIFRPWMPQTAADHDARVNVLKLIIQREPEVAWRLLMSLLPRGPQVGHYNHKPRWRNEGYGYGEPIPKRGPVASFMTAVADLALDWPEGYDESRLCDLLEASAVMDTAYLEKIWGHVERWAPTAGDAQRAVVREKIRVTMFGRRAKLDGGKRADWGKRQQGAKSAYELLLPTDLVSKHAWLFKDIWLHDFGIEGEEPDFQARDARLRQLRSAALAEIYAALGLDGLLSAAKGGKAARVVGAIAAEHVLDEPQLQALVALTIQSDAVGSAEKEVVSGALTALPAQGREQVLVALRQALPVATYCEVLKLCSFTRETWLRVDQLPETERQRYWQEISPWYAQEEEAEEAVQRLAEAGRPRAAFAVTQHHLKRLEPAVLYGLLSQIARAPEPEPGGYQLEQHSLIDAFERLNAATELSVEEKAFLEFAYIEALWVMRDGGRDTHLVPNLERYLEDHPEFYVQALAWAFKRRDEGVDPEELRAPPGAATSNLALRCYKLLESMTRLPAYRGASAPTYDNLSAWISQVRARAAEIARLEVADMTLGKLLSAAPAGDDGVWPGDLARRAIEEIGTEDVAEGVRVAAFNSRGVIWRGRGGDQERELAAKYRTWAQALRYTHPFVSSEVLEALADNYDRMAKREDEQEVLRERVRD
ncbi:HigA family addiction module antitoxin [Ramlibacter humi]|uniref:Addiction module antidote protein, HigA family n=1 Tax=Ramlibacter humi TaxID=2530451 RepID=A0A4Z0CD89_9BURK|nr:HigA family addiction module antitoxin [Ramlibacter humi]TFZ08942.1 addiction module antidote protein, HigA family [Ramlibacter humi]